MCAGIREKTRRLNKETPCKQVNIDKTHVPGRYTKRRKRQVDRVCVCVWMELRSSHGVRLFVCSRWKVISLSFLFFRDATQQQTTCERNERRDAPVGHFHSQES